MRLYWVESPAGELRRDRSVMVHCRGGIGRWSTLAAAALTRLGVEPEAAMDAISQARGMRVPETMGQRMWCTATRWRGSARDR